MPAVLNILALLACSHPDRPDARIVYGVDDPCLDELGGFPDDTEESLANEEAGCETYGGTSCDRDRFIVLSLFALFANEAGAACDTEEDYAQRCSEGERSASCIL